MQDNRYYLHWEMVFILERACSLRIYIEGTVNVSVQTRTANSRGLCKGLEKYLYLFRYVRLGHVQLEHAKAQKLDHTGRCN